jgi:hypothetical protein
MRDADPKSVEADADSRIRIKSRRLNSATIPLPEKKRWYWAFIRTIMLLFWENLWKAVFVNFWNYEIQLRSSLAIILEICLAWNSHLRRSKRAKYLKHPCSSEIHASNSFYAFRSRTPDVYCRNCYRRWGANCVAIWSWDKSSYWRRWTVFWTEVLVKTVPSESSIDLTYPALSVTTESFPSCCGIEIVVLTTFPLDL